MSTLLVLLSLVGAVAAQQQQYLPWEQQNVGSIPAWYAPKTAGFAAQAGSAMNVAPPLGSPFPSSFAARPSYPPNFPGYPTFGTVQPVGPSASKSGGNPYSTTYKPKTTTGFWPKPAGGRSNLDKYLPLMKKKKAMTTTTTARPTAAITKRRKLPAKKTTVTRPTSRPTTRPSTTTVRPTTTTAKPTTTTADSTEWESLEVVEKSSTVRSTTTTMRATTEKRKEEEKEDRKKAELVKGPIVQKGRPDKALPPSTTSTTKSPKSSEEEDKEAEFNLLGFLWDKSELLASIKNMIKQLKSSIDEAGLEEDVKQVSDHFKNTIKTFASASPVNEQLGRLFERAQNADVNKLE